MRHCVSKRPDDRGFTLVEILIAVVLVGVLASVAVVGISNLVDKGAKAACSASADAARAAAAVYLTSHASYPVDFTALTTSSGTGATAIPAALALPAGVTASGVVATAAGGRWTLTMTPGSGGIAPTFACAAGQGVLTSAWEGLPDGQAGVEYAAVSISAARGTSPYTWSATGLPAGLTIGPSTGTVSGTPLSAGTFPATVTVADAAAASLSHSYSIVVIPAVVVAVECPGRLRASRGGWRGEYFGTVDLSGPPLLCRDDAAIDFDWRDGSPSADVPADGFSVRWTRTETLAEGDHTFTLAADDGSRLFVDGELILDRWDPEKSRETPPMVTVALAAGKHTLVVEYHERDKLASVSFRSSVGSGAAGECPIDAVGWLGEYFPDGDLGGRPALCRDDASVDFDWADGAPLEGMPKDTFAVRWTTTQRFGEGAYTFALGTDDGGRLFIDGKLVIDAWFDQLFPEKPPSVTMDLGGGTHTLVVEYYDASGPARVALTITPPT